MTRTLTRHSTTKAEPAEAEEPKPTARRRPIRGTARTEATTPEPEDTDEPEDDEEPTPRSRKRIDNKPEEKKRTRKIASGWAGYSEVRKETSEFHTSLEVDDEDIVIKFLDAEPFANFNQHWIERKGKKSWPCIENCPLCDLGDKAKTQSMINVLDFRDPANPQVVVWQFGTMVGDILKDFGKSERTRPLDRLDIYFSVSKSGGGRKGRVAYNVRPIKERDLLADWDIQPLTQAEVDGYFEKGYEADIVQIPSTSQMNEIADEIADED